MSVIDSLPASLIVPIVFLVFYAFTSLKLVKESSQDPEFRISSQSTQDGQQSLRITSLAAAPPSDPSLLIIEKASEFPADWWSRDDTFQLERRAIFSKSWIYTTHRSLFVKPGDYLNIQTAGFAFFLILGKDHVLRAFHNVCRHRAYEVIRKERGSSTVLGCRYHGWSYNTKGQLMKAPEFDKVPEFDKEKNGLWEIHVQVSAQGLVFVNLNAAKTVNKLSLGELNGAGKHWSMSQPTMIAEWRFESSLNWKLAVTMNSSDSDAVLFIDDIPENSRWVLGLFRVKFKQNRPLHTVIDLFTTVIVYPVQAIFLVVRIMPQSAAKTTIAYDLYTQVAQDQPSLAASREKLKNASFAEIERLQILQHQLIEGSSILGHEQREQQNAISALLTAHQKHEILEGSEIHPAARQISLSGAGREDVKLCKVLEKSVVNGASCPANTDGFPRPESLDW